MHVRVLCKHAVTYAACHAQEIGLAARPKRSGFGTAGRPIKIKANHFKVACALLSSAHYDVTITGLRGRRSPVEGEEEEAAPADGPPRRGRRADAPTRPLPPEVCR